MKANCVRRVLLVALLGLALLTLSGCREFPSLAPLEEPPEWAALAVSLAFKPPADAGQLS